MFFILCFYVCVLFLYFFSFFFFFFNDTATTEIYTLSLHDALPMEADQHRTGQDAAQWQELVASYLIQVAAEGQHPHLAAVLGGPPEDDDAQAQEPIFNRA